MAFVAVEEANMFVFTWVIENFSYCLQKCGERLLSPTFNLKDETEWCVTLLPRGEKDSKGNEGKYIACYLCAQPNNFKSIVVGFQFEFLNASGETLQSQSVPSYEFTKTGGFGLNKFELLRDIYAEKSRTFLPNDVLTVRCRMWRPEKKTLQGGQCLARTHIGTKTTQFLWKIEEFTSLSSVSKGVTFPWMPKEELRITFYIKKEGVTFYKEPFDIEITVEGIAKKQLLVCAFKLLDCKDEIVLSKERQIALQPDEGQTKLNITSFVDKMKLMQKKAEYLPNDTLNILCEVTLSKGVVHNEIEKYEPHQLVHHSDILINQSKLEAGVMNDLKYDLLQVFTKGTLSDVSLQSGTDTFPAHKAHLSARSAVFETMFSTDKKEKTLEVVPIEDLDADTIRRLLLYIYSDFVELLDLKSAKKLYHAADKYQIALLQRKCADYLLEKLSKDNVCEILLFAHGYQDAYLKQPVFDFICGHIKEIMDSKNWRTLMKNNARLASEVMYSAIMR